MAHVQRDLIEFSEWKARVSDPETSQQAAKELEERASGLRRQFVEGIKRCGGRATAKEAGYAMSRNPELAESIRKRAKECVDSGFVKVCGERECKVSGNRCQVYEVRE